MIQVIQRPDIADLRKALRGHLTQIFNTHLDRPILLMISGGSMLSLFDEPLSILQSENITLTVVDERWSTDPEVNNFLQLEQTSAYQDLVQRGSRFISTVPRPSESLSDFAQRFESSLKEWRTLNKTGVIVALLGVGSDGHTAGILPQPEVPNIFNDRFINTKNWVVGYESNNRYPFRATATGHFLITEVGEALIYAVGQEKKQALMLTLKGDRLLAQTPAAITQEMKSVTLYTDQVID